MPLAAVDVGRDSHHIVIIGAERDGWEAMAGYGINKPAAGVATYPWSLTRIAEMLD